MYEIEVTDELKVRVDTMGRVTIMQMDPVINPAIATSVISVSASTGDKLLKALGEVIKLHDAEEWQRRRVG